MEPNLSILEIVERYIILFVLGLLFGITHWYIFIVLAVIVFITAVSGWSPLYQILGINHCSDEEHH